MTIKDLKRGDLFYTAADYAKHGDNEKYLRIRDDYDHSTKKYYCPRLTVDALGCGRSYPGNTEIVVI